MMDLKKIRSELQKLTAIVEGWEHPETVPPLERDLALEKLRSLYEAVRFGAADAAVEPSAETQPAEDETVSAPIDLGAVLSLDPFADSPSGDGPVPAAEPEAIPARTAQADSAEATGAAVPADGTAPVDGPDPAFRAGEPAPVAALESEPTAGPAGDPANIGAAEIEPATVGAAEADPARGAAAEPLEAPSTPSQPAETGKEPNAHPAAKRRYVAPTLFGPEDETVRHRHKQRVILSLYDPVPAEKSAESGSDSVPPSTGPDRQAASSQKASAARDAQPAADDASATFESRSVATEAERANEPRPGEAMPAPQPSRSASQSERPEDAQPIADPLSEPIATTIMTPASPRTPEPTSAQGPTLSRTSEPIPAQGSTPPRTPEPTATATATPLQTPTESSADDPDWAAVRSSAEARESFRPEEDDFEEIDLTAAGHATAPVSPSHAGSAETATRASSTASSIGSAATATRASAPASSAGSSPLSAKAQTGAVLGEVINHDVQTLADTIAPPRDVASQLRRSEPVADLRRAIGLNDRFLLIRDLFDGDAAAYEAAIERLNAFDDFDECMIHIAENYAWNPDSDGAKLIMDLLERKFA